MTYVRRDLTDGKTIIDKALLDHMQDGIIEGISKAEALEVVVNDIKSKSLETDPTLTKEGFAADAKAVGDLINNISVSVETDKELKTEGKAADAGAVGQRLSELGQLIGTNTVKIDTTLEIAGQAADAKAVGDRLKVLEDAIPEQIEVVNSLNVTEPGKVPDAIVVAEAITNVQSAIPQVISSFEGAQPGTVPDATVVAETIKTVQSAIPPVTTTLEVEDPEVAVPAVKVVKEAIESAKTEVIETVKTETVETVKVEAIEAVKAEIPSLIPVDTTLSEAGKPADAATVGQAIESAKTEVIETVKTETVETVKTEVVEVVKTEVKTEVIETVKEEITSTGVKNPAAITFTGAVTGTYDGSEALTINIPEGGGESNMEAITNEQINELVNLV